jgi:hypothetical protein
MGMCHFAFLSFAIPLRREAKLLISATKTKSRLVAGAGARLEA